MVINEYTKQKQKDLSERLALMAIAEHKLKALIDRQIVSENLHYNLGYVLAHIINDLKIQDRSLAAFEKIIDDYNTSHATTLSFNDFTERAWLRVIYGEIIIPERISLYLLNRNATIPIDDKDKIECLVKLEQSRSNTSNKIISYTVLNHIISTYSSSELNSSFFIEKGILLNTSDPDMLIWNESSNYVRLLNNEIATCLWLITTESSITEESFRRYAHLLLYAGIFPNHITAFLSFQHIQEIGNRAASVLRDELDLDSTDQEVSKARMDSRFGKNYDIFEQPPVIQFKKDSSYELIKQFEYSLSAERELFYHQHSRMIYHLLLSLVLQTSYLSQNPFESAISLLKEQGKAYLVWSIFLSMSSDYPELIPYILTEPELAPIAFLAVDKLEPGTLVLNWSAEFQVRNNQKLNWANEICLELFDLLLTLSLASPSIERYSSLYHILYDLSIKTFKYNSQNPTGIAEQEVMQKRLVQALIMIRQKRIINSNNSIQGNYPRLLISVLDHLLKLSSEVPTKLHRNEFLDLDLAHFHLTIELIKLGSLQFIKDEMLEDQLALIQTQKRNAIDNLKFQLESFYALKEISFKDRYSGKMITKKGKRDLNHFGLEIIDWGYLYLQFQELGKIDELDSFFRKTIQLNISSSNGIYDEDNQQECEKISYYLKIILLAYLGIQTKRNAFELDGLEVRPTLFILENISKELSIKYSVNRMIDSRIDIFNETFRHFNRNFLYEPLSSLLFKSLNYQNEDEVLSFIESFFKNSVELSRMLNAINLIDSKLIDDAISSLVENIPVEDFIHSVSTVTDLINALVEATNAETNWSQLTEELVKRIKNHFNTKGYSDKNSEDILYQVALIAAFKGKNLSELESVEVKETTPLVAKEEIFRGNLKKYYIAIFKLFHLESYDEAIDELTQLSISDPTNLLFNLNLYKAKTAKAVRTNDSALFNQSYIEWNDFLQNIDPDKLKETYRFQGEIDITRLYYFMHFEDFQSFDLIFSRMPNKYIYHEEILESAFNFYLMRNLYHLASEYLLKARSYYSKNIIPYPPTLTQLLENYPSEEIIRALKETLNNLSSQRPVDIPRILPNNINGKIKLKQFILAEFVNASKVMIEKIEAIRHIEGENRFNDLIYAILKLRMPLWGWGLQDQTRMGRSLRGREAGEVDFVIQSGGTTIALCEAFIFSTKPITAKHLLKCRNYNDSLNCYYILVYHLKEHANFENSWKAYQRQVSSTKYPADFQFDSSTGFVDLSSEFENVMNMKIAKTTHQKYELFHLMLNIGEY